jgi:TatD DNase family protein
LEKSNDDRTIKYDVASLINRASAANVQYLLAIGTELSDVEELQSIVDQFENVFKTVGIHPLDAKSHKTIFNNNEISRIINECCVLSKTVAIGEIGLDYHYEKESEKQQKELFNLQLELARKNNLPVVIHSREAYQDVIDILKDHCGVTGVIHCFSGEKDFAIKALDLGFYISISGAITFKNAIELQETVKLIPLEKMLIETDSPFLAPAPFRGKPNEPAFIPYIAQKISELIEKPIEIIAKHTSKNFFELFIRDLIKYEKLILFYIYFKL